MGSAAPTAGAFDSEVKAWRNGAGAHRANPLPCDALSVRQGAAPVPAISTGRMGAPRPGSVHNSASGAL